MIASIQFRDFRVLERATLPLGPFNLLVGPNGSGKTTAMRALLAVGEVARALQAGRVAPVFADLAGAAVEFSCAGAAGPARAGLRFDSSGQPTLDASNGTLIAGLAGVRGYVLDPIALARSCPHDAVPELACNGAGLPAVLASLRRSDGSRWDIFLAEVRRLLPEFTDVVAGKTVNGDIAFSVTTQGGKNLRPENLSQGALAILALLAIALRPERPTVLCFEELERGIHPRLLRDVRDVLYRLSFPQDAGDDAPPVQLVVTTHSPYVLDLFADTPEDVIIAAKDEAGTASFKRLVDIPELHEMLENGHLGDLWYSGILGGVP